VTPLSRFATRQPVSVRPIAPRCRAAKAKTVGQRNLRPASRGDCDILRNCRAPSISVALFLVLESTGDVWIAELGHAARKDGRFGVVLELKKAAFAVKGDRLTGHYRTNGEESFGDSKYTIDITFDAPQPSTMTVVTRVSRRVSFPSRLHSTRRRGTTSRSDSTLDERVLRSRQVSRACPQRSESEASAETPSHRIHFTAKRCR
jgi:hypothetical protein